MATLTDNPKLNSYHDSVWERERVNKYLLPLVLISVEFPEIGADAWDVLFFGVAKEKSSKKLISNKPCVNPLLASRK